jgi:hypothetical protein
MSTAKKPAGAADIIEDEVVPSTDKENATDSDVQKTDAPKAERSSLGLKPAKPLPSIDESIQLALASASTAADASKEIQRLKKQVNDLVIGNSRSNKVLLGTGVIFLFMASVALGVSVAFYFKAMNRFDSITNVNRDALMSFAEEVNAFTEAATRVEQAATASEKRLAALSEQQEQIRLAIQSDLTNQQTLQTKLSENSDAITQIPAATRKMVDDLLASNKVLIGQFGDAMRDQIKAMEAANPKADIVKQIDDIVKTQQAATIRTSAIAAQKANSARKSAPASDQMIKYP